MHLIRFLFLAVLVFGLSGCRSPSRGPRFDPYVSLSADGMGGISTNLLFQYLETTNRVDPAWLGPPRDFFRLGPGDIVDIEVFGEKDSASTAFVGPDGKIYYSLLPGTFVWGMTLAEAKSALEQELKKYLRGEPEVGLILRGVSSRRIWILGNVQRPGIYTLATPMTLLESIASAGGTGNAVPVTTTHEDPTDLKNSFVMRDGRMLSVDFYKLLRQGDLTQNIYLQPGDYIYLRPAVSRDIYVLGAVVLPNIVPYSDQASLVGAVAAVGGPIRFAYLSHVAVVRGSLSNPTIAVVDYQDIVKGRAADVRLEPGDIVYVPFSPYRRLVKFAELILNEFVRTVALNEGQNVVLEDAQPVGVSVGVGNLSAPAAAP